ncbi:hypothetical protein LEP1GSC145_0674 [Leptospira interrogans serovar Djasiman str. LT1649]|nr:hypothetical protein LEP1GSC145_0674 [Leptospira interrogans serovar Djasiman str. LT1649]
MLSTDVKTKAKRLYGSAELSKRLYGSAELSKRLSMDRRLDLKIPKISS